MEKKRYRIFFTALLLAALFSVSAQAAETGKLFSKASDQNSLYLYIPAPDEGAELSCRIGTNAGAELEILPVRGSAVSAKTYFLIDNSLSVAEGYRPKIQEILTELAASRMENERYTIAAFSDQLNYLLEDSSDYAQIRQVLSSVAYQDQETYLTDVLYELLSGFQQEETPSYRRIVIVSDGVDNKALGYTKEELYDLLEKLPCPIYTLGCSNKDNQEELKNMFALSRLTGGQSWLLDDVTDPMEVVNGVAVSGAASQVRIVPEEADCDGSTKGVSLTVTAADRTIVYQTEMQMPFAEPAETEPEETNLTETKAPETGEAEDGTSKVQGEIPGMTVIGLVLLGIFGLGGAGIVWYRKRKRQSAFKQEELQEKCVQEEPADGHETAFVSASELEEEAHVTHFAWERSVELEDMQEAGKCFKAGIQEGGVLVGYSRDCQIRLNYDESVSGKHCRIFEENGTVQVCNLSHTNPTLLNHHVLKGNEELKDGDILTLGRLNMKVKLKI